jgi:hypothetical protein
MGNPKFSQLLDELTNAPQQRKRGHAHHCSRASAAVSKHSFPTHTHTPSVAFSFLKVPHMEENMSDNSKKNCGSAWSASKNNLLSPMKSTKQTWTESVFPC